MLNIIVHLWVHIHVCILVLLNIGRDIGSICTRMLLIRIYLFNCASILQIFIFCWSGFPMWFDHQILSCIFRKIDYIFTFSLQFLRFFFFHLPLTMTWISYLDCQLIASWQNCSSLAAFDQKIIWIDTLVSLLVMGIDFYRFRENQNFKDM